MMVEGCGAWLPEVDRGRDVGGRLLTVVGVRDRREIASIHTCCSGV